MPWHNFIEYLPLNGSQFLLRIIFRHNSCQSPSLRFLLLLRRARSVGDGIVLRNMQPLRYKCPLTSTPVPFFGPRLAVGPMQRSPTCTDSHASAAVAVLAAVGPATKVLGIPVSLWNPEAPDDLLEPSFLKVFSILSHSFAGLLYPSSKIVSPPKFSHLLFHLPPSHGAISS